MDLSCIISSGDLELYVLGMLPADEAEKITVLAGLFPEIEDEISRISSTLISVGDNSVNQPSPAVKDNLMQQFSEMKRTESPTDTAPVVSMKPKIGGRTPWLAAASVAAVIFAGGFIYMMKLNADQKALTSEQDRRIIALEKNLTTKDETVRESQVMLNMFRSEEYLKINLRQMPGANPAEVELFWNTRTKEVYVGGMQLPEAPSGKQYQLWAIVNGKPVDAGVMGKAQLQKMKTFEKAEAFAITLEKEGGSPTPTMEAMIVMANT